MWIRYSNTGDRVPTTQYLKDDRHLWFCGIWNAYFLNRRLERHAEADAIKRCVMY